VTADTPGRLTRELEQAIHEMGIAPVEWNMGEVGPRVEAIRRWRSVLREALAALAAEGETPPMYPIPLSEAQRQAVKEWAADDRLWTTQETVEINLRIFARKILALAAEGETPPASITEAQRAGAETFRRLFKHVPLSDVERLPEPDYFDPPAPSGETSPPALVEVVRNAAPFVREVWDAHRDPDDNDYNECEKQRCAWCDGVAALLAYPLPTPVAGEGGTK
jgi:hypothetical protein